MTSTATPPWRIVEGRRLLVGGELVTGRGTPLVVDNPATEATVAEVPGASVEDVEMAIRAARECVDDERWSGRSAQVRAATLHRLAEDLMDRRDELVATLVIEVGKPWPFAEYEVDSGLRHLRQVADQFLTLPEEHPNPVPLDEALRGGRGPALSTTRYEPVGVVAGIAAFNAPFYTAVWKLAPALITGCSVIVRPSPLAPLSVLAIGEAAARVGLPPGSLNVVAEAGHAGAHLLTTHVDVDAVTFTGSAAVGRSIASQASATLKRLMLELGGKSAQIYLPDAVERAADGALDVFRALSGQACVAGTRILVPHHEVASVEAELAARVGKEITVGNPQDPTVDMGPLISDAQVGRCERIVAEAVAAGATLVVGGCRPSSHRRGHFFEPTVVHIEDNQNPAAQEEIFGPVVTIQGYRDVDEAVSIANESEYGLSGYLYTEDRELGLDVARRIRTGNVNVNASASNAYSPIGAYKQSGIGTERGRPGIRAFQQLKHIVVA